MKKALLVLLCLVLAAVLAYQMIPTQERESDDTLSLYYPAAKTDLSGGGDAIRTTRVDWRDMRGESVQTQVDEVLRLLMGGCEDKNFRMPMPAGTKLQLCQIIGSTVWVDFSAAYGQRSGIELTMADYCVALSLVQIPSVYTVRITVDGRGLAYRERNDFRADDILVTSPEDVVRNVAVQLYFLKEASLASEERILTIYEGESQAEEVIHALLNGPESEALQPLLPEDFPVLSVRVEEEICYLNLSSECEVMIPASIGMQRLMISSIVRSLCSVRNVKEVQFLVDGERQQVLGQIDISQPLTALP